MSVHEILPAAYHQQDTDYFCGATCAQMVLASIGAGLISQSALYADNHSHSTIESGWYSGPDGLQWTLNDRRPAAFANWFALFALGSEDAISRKICWTIHHYKVAPVALVFDSAHWIVVHGYSASSAPAGSADTAYAINGFDVNNPWPPVPTSHPPPPHSAGDGCGSGGNRGIANEHISHATWQSDYMTGASGGYWNGKFVAICDPEPPADRLGQQPPPPLERLPGERLIEPAAAAERAVDGLRTYQLYERAPWREALRRTSPGDPILVERLDRPDSYYYLVPMQLEGQRRRNAPVVVSVDARFGNYRQAASLPRQSSSVLLTLDRQALLERLMDNEIDLEEPLGRVPVRPNAHCLYPTLVWRPCRESLSPFYPFYMLVLGDQRVYIRVDGRVFASLHTTDRGL